MTAPTADPFAATSAAARYAAYDELAAGGPVARITLPNGVPAWLVTGYAEVRAALNDPRLVKAPTPSGVLVAKHRPEVFPALGSHMLQADGTEHTRLRRLVAAAFTKGAMEALAPRIREIADGLADDLAVHGPDDVVDLLDAYAYPLPMTVICDMLGVPAGQREPFHDGAATMMAGTFVGEAEFLAAVDSLVALLRELVAAKRAQPADDLLSALVAVRDDGDSLTENELTSLAMLLVIAGHETTVNLIGNGVALLLARPVEWHRLRSDPALLPTAIEELLRFAGPAQVTFPVVATEPLELGGVTIGAGGIVVPSILAANRDPRHTPEPATLDLARSPNPHVAFGHGIHHCLGAPLARLEGRIALEVLLERFPDLAPAVDPDALVHRPNFLFHGLASLPVRLGKAA